MRRIRFITLPLAMGAILLSIAALAAPRDESPPECRGFPPKYYHLRYIAWVNSVPFEFHRHYDCNSFESFAYEQRAALLRMTSLNQCERAAAWDATNDAINQIAQECFNVPPSHSSSSDLGGAYTAAPRRCLGPGPSR